MAQDSGYVYKIGTSFPEGLDGRAFPLSDLDKVNDGFIHLSTKAQVPGTVGRFFKDINEIVLLKIPVARIQDKTKWEASSSHGIFPHIYGDLLESDVQERKTFKTEDASKWEAMLNESAWLE
ncbi:hypothetical protein BCR37DRAFT_121258 [Protomyces lactucae-debilis]|uniref:DUF952 domain-containing protein n=1 Tax=Protomyces lactucae-debilis TaxID=2754530 RepID=A0A1Y2F1L6_PROLT|nr:uncharacterized protein BCR37DRAFT_121258 [Protomyces lactucae-debilis]ORY77750.1 hypothetical protein BCR37DRAFT_121258 [Protomyces lactucae-debilis]